jgi:heme-degrading monooxygenase HmoA
MVHWKNLPQTPKWAVIFSLERTDQLRGYAEMDEATLKAVANIPGYLGYESVYNGNRGIFISYWDSKEAIDHWAAEGLHLRAKAAAPQWYAWYISAITEVHQWHTGGSFPPMV